MQTMQRVEGMKKSKEGKTAKFTLQDRRLTCFNEPR